MIRKTAKGFLKGITKTVMSALFGTKMTGGLPENPPERSIVVANHESFLDGIVLASVLPKSWDPVFVVHSWVAKSLLFKPFLAMVDYVAVDPTSPMAMKTLTRLVEKGRPVVIFPEGRLTTTGSLMKIYEGPAFLAARTGATLFPVRLSGTGRSYFTRLSGEHPKRLFPQIEAALATPSKLDVAPGGKARERRRKAGEALRALMQRSLMETTKPKTLWQLLNEAGKEFGWSRMLLEDVSMTEISYRKLAMMAAALGRWVEKETPNCSRVGVMTPNVGATLGIIFGSSGRGRTPCMINYTAGKDAILSSMRATECSTIVSSRSFVEKAKLSDVVSFLSDAGLRFVWLEDFREKAGFKERVAALIDSRRGVGFERADRRDPETEALILFTSGSEGAPKGVVLSHRAIASNAAQIKSVMDVSAEDKFLCALPLFHSFGMTAGAVLPLLSGSRLFLYPSPLHYRVIPEVAYDRNCTVLFGTNTFLANYARFADPYDFCKLRRVVAGAEKLQDSTREIWNDKFGLRIFEGYGATETAPVLSVNTPNAFKKGSVGRFLPGIEHRLISVPGVEKGGRLMVKGPNLMSGYLKAEAPRKLIPPECEAGKGWHDLGDIVEIDEEGYVFIKGRVKRFAKIAGEMVSLETAEAVALSASPNAVHACSLRKDPQKGESLVLFTTDASLTREALSAAARSMGKSELSVAKDIRTLQSIPLLGTGKTDYALLGKMAEDK